MESKKKLQSLEQYLFSEFCYRLDKDESLRIKYCFIAHEDKDVHKYIKGAYGIDVIEKDLDKLERIESIIKDYEKYKSKPYRPAEDYIRLIKEVFG